jgi:tetratricopeptide (TPR) repeat protein
MRVHCFPTIQKAGLQLAAAGLALLLLTPAARAQQTPDKPADPKAEMLTLYNLDPAFDGPGMEELTAALDALKAGNGDKTLEQLKAANDKNKSLPPARVLLARLLFAAKQNDPARQQLETAAADEKDRESPDLYLVFGNLALAEGRLTDASLEFHKALEAAKITGSPDAASEDQKRLQRQVYAGLTIVAERRADWTQAEASAILWLGVAGKDDKAQAELRLANAKFMSGGRAEAEEHLKLAQGLDKELLPAKVYMALMAQQKADPKAAEKYYQEALESDPSNSKVHSAYSEWLLGANRVNEAQKQATEAATLDPKSDALKRLSAVIDMHQKRYADAAKAFREMYQKSPSDTFASNYLALALAASKDSDDQKQAAELAEINARQFPKSPEILATLGWVYFRLGRYSEAEQVLGAVVSNNRIPSADAAYYLANVLAERDRLTEASQLLEAALKAPGAFLYREEAETWLNQLKPKRAKTSSTLESSSDTKEAPVKEAPKAAPAATPKK